MNEKPKYSLDEAFKKIPTANFFFLKDAFETINLDKKLYRPTEYVKILTLMTHRLAELSQELIILGKHIA